MSRRINLTPAEAEELANQLLENAELVNQANREGKPDAYAYVLFGLKAGEEIFRIRIGA